MQIIGDDATVARFSEAWDLIQRAGQSYVDFVEQWCPLLKQIQEDFAALFLAANGCPFSF